MSAEFLELLYNHARAVCIDIPPFKQVQPFKEQRCQLVTLGYPGLTYIFNFWHLGTLVLSPECQSARMSEINKQPMGCEAQLACKCLFTVQFYRSAIWTSKVGQGDLVFDCDLGLLVGLCVHLLHCRSTKKKKKDDIVRVRIMERFKSFMSYCVQRLWLVPSWLSQNVIRTFRPHVTLKIRSNSTLLCIHIRCTHHVNLVTAGPQGPEILHIRIWSSPKNR